MRMRCRGGSVARPDAQVDAVSVFDLVGVASLRPCDRAGAQTCAAIAPKDNFVSSHGSPTPLIADLITGSARCVTEMAHTLWLVELPVGLPKHTIDGAPWGKAIFETKCFGVLYAGGVRVALNQALIKLAIIAMMSGARASPSSAGGEDSTFFISPGGGNVTFRVWDGSRREVIGRLLAGRSVELEWRDLSVADEPIRGTFKGSPDSVLQRLLKQIDFVVVYDRDRGKLRISRLIVAGKVASERSSPRSAEAASATCWRASLGTNDFEIDDCRAEFQLRRAKQLPHSYSLPRLQRRFHFCTFACKVNYANHADSGQSNDAT
jgi:hypothetical protein